MPIRINLLAERQAAEELRRRDPVKRVVFGGCALVVLVIGWITVTQMQVWAARSELDSANENLKKLEDTSKQAKNSQIASLDGERRLKALDRYSANRFFWGTFLDALQHASVDNIRLTEVRADQKYNVGEATKFFTTNFTVNYTPPVPAWKFWAKPTNEPPISITVSNMLGPVTNLTQFKTNTLPYSVKVAEDSTNTAAHWVSATVDFTYALRSMEKTTIEIRGRDYSATSGAALDELAKRITSSPYFKGILDGSRGLRFTERPPQPRPDPQDPANPNALFVPFTIELVLNERIFTNEQNL